MTITSPSHSHGFLPRPVNGPSLTAMLLVTVVIASVVNTTSRLAAVAQEIPVQQQVLQPLSEIERRMASGDAGQETQAAQARLLEALDRWIADSQRREADEKGAAGKAAARGRGPGSTSANSPDNQPPPTTDDPNAPRMPNADAGPSGLWGRLNPQQRQALLQSWRERGFPARYRQQLESYYREKPTRNSATPRDPAR